MNRIRIASFILIVFIVSSCKRKTCYNQSINITSLELKNEELILQAENIHCNEELLGELYISHDSQSPVEIGFKGPLSVNKEAKTIVIPLENMYYTQDRFYEKDSTNSWGSKKEYYDFLCSLGKDSLDLWMVFGSDHSFMTINERWKDGEEIVEKEKNP